MRAWSMLSLLKTCDSVIVGELTLFNLQHGRVTFKSLKKPSASVSSLLL